MKKTTTNYFCEFLLWTNFWQMLFMSHTTASEKPWTPAVWSEIIYSHSYILMLKTYLQKSKKNVDTTCLDMHLSFQSWICHWNSINFPFANESIKWAFMHFMKWILVVKNQCVVVSICRFLNFKTVKLS